MRDYVHGLNGLLATDGDGEGIRHYSTDHLGSPRLVTDWMGIRQDYSRFWPYGEKYTGTIPDYCFLRDYRPYRRFGEASEWAAFGDS